MGYRYHTKQSRLVEAFLKENADRHFTADELFFALKARGGTVGKTTVYRQLERLCEGGTVRKFLSDGGGACFQYTGGLAPEKDCYHLKCTQCGRLFHTECAFLDRLCAHIYSEHGFRMDGSKLILYGVCGDCAQKNGKADEANA